MHIMLAVVVFLLDMLARGQRGQRIGQRVVATLLGLLFGHQVLSSTLLCPGRLMITLARSRENSRNLAGSR
jgi:hypothetical protein